jgi:hypothetical protein
LSAKTLKWLEQAYDAEDQSDEEGDDDHDSSQDGSDSDSDSGESMDDYDPLAHDDREYEPINVAG